MGAPEVGGSYRSLQGDEAGPGSWGSWQAWRAWVFEPETLPERQHWEERWRAFLSGHRWLHPNVLEKAEELEAKGKRVTNFHFAGPAILEVWNATFVQWGFAVLFPVLVCFLSDCPRTEEPFAHFPKWVVVFFLPVLLYSMKCEFKALRFMVCTMAQYCAPFTFLRRPVSFGCWLGSMVVLSLMTHMDLATNGLFLAKILKTMSCENEKTRAIREIWARAIESSPMVRWLPGFGHLDLLCPLVWALMLPQPAICLLYGCPRQKGVSYAAESECEGYRTVWSQFWRTSERKSDKAWVLHHADILQWLATANRMVSLTDKSLSWTKARAMEMLEDTSPDYVRVWDMVRREFARITHRLWLVNILEKACQIEVQTTIFAVSRYLIPRNSPWRVDGQMLISLLFSFATFAKVIYDHTCQLLIIWNCKCEAEKKTPEAVKKALREQLALERWKLIQTAAGFVLGLLILMVFLLHSLAKFVMAFVCEDSVWNIPLSDASGLDDWGCMQLAQFLPP